MKTTLVAFALSSGLFLGCSGTSSNERGTHTHEDGSVHADHAQIDTTRQEEFTVNGDSTATSTKAHDHPHKDEGDHKH